MRIKPEEEEAAPGLERGRTVGPDGAFLAGKRRGAHRAGEPHLLPEEAGKRGGRSGPPHGNPVRAHTQGPDGRLPSREASPGHPRSHKRPRPTDAQAGSPLFRGGAGVNRRGTLLKPAFFREHGGPDKIQYGDLPDPAPGPGQVRVRIRAGALNHLDLFVLRGIPGIPVTLPPLMGSGGAGRLEGGGAAGGRAGEGAAAVPLTPLTAGRMLVTKARAKPGESILVVGIGGGVAVAALQIAKMLGLTVWVTSGR